MTVLAQPNHPARLAALFLATALAVSVVAAAAISVLYLVQDMRDDGRVSDVAGASAAPAPRIEAPEGLIVVTQVETPEQFAELAGFAPFVPDTLPASSDTTPHFAVTQPDENGFRVGRVQFSAREGWSVDGVSGPLIVIGQAKGAPGEGVDGQLKRIVGGSRALVSTLACGDLVLDIQMYFSPDARADEPIVTPYMRDVAVKFLDGIRDQCGG